MGSTAIGKGERAMGIAIGKRTQVGAVAATSPASQGAGPVPGKQTLTEQLADQMRAQERQVCDVASPGCFLDEVTRQRLDDDIRANITGAMVAWSSALLNKRMDALAKHADGWSTLWKIAGAVAMAGLGQGVGLAIDWLAASAESAAAVQATAQIVNREKTVHKIFDMAGEHVLEKVKDKVNESANETGNAKADYLSTLIDGPHQWGTGLMKAFPKQLDDYGRLLLLGVTDEKVMTARAFGQRIDALLARWQDQVGDLGESGCEEGHALTCDSRVETAAWIYPRFGGAPRLARVRAVRPPQAFSGERDRLLRVDLFRRWVDGDMVAYALDDLNKRDDLHVRGPLHLSDVPGAPVDPETLAWERGHGAYAAGDGDMWPDFGKTPAWPMPGRKGRP
jgi:hypothetical protein